MHDKRTQFGEDIQMTILRVISRRCVHGWYHVIYLGGICDEDLKHKIVVKNLVTFRTWIIL